MTKNEVNEKIKEYCEKLAVTLIAKNNAYNNSLHNQASTFHKGSTIDGICCRLDDKLNRIKQAGINGDTEDSIGDLIGYLVHLEICLCKI